MHLRYNTDPLDTPEWVAKRLTKCKRPIRSLSYLLNKKAEHKMLSWWHRIGQKEFLENYNDYY